MQPLFTIHAGEYLEGSHIEQNVKFDGEKVNVWVPSKDTGVDLLVTDHTNKNTTSIQVKYSKDFLATDSDKQKYLEVLKACGWWKLKPEKIQKSSADLWVFVLPSHKHGSVEYLIIPRAKLAEQLASVGNSAGEFVNSYLWVSENHQCWDVRGLKKHRKDALFSADNGECATEINCARDFSQYINRWSVIFEHWDQPA